MSLLKLQKVIKRTNMIMGTYVRLDLAVSTSYTDLVNYCKETYGVEPMTRDEQEAFHNSFIDEPAYTIEPTSLVLVANTHSRFNK